MKVGDYVRSVKSTIDTLARLGLKIEDADFLDMYDRYIDMKKNGDKINYIAEVLSEEYGIKRRKFFYLVKIFDSVI